MPKFTARLLCARSILDHDMAYSPLQTPTWLCRSLRANGYWAHNDSLPARHFLGLCPLLPGRPDRPHFTDRKTEAQRG